MEPAKTDKPVLGEIPGIVSKNLADNGKLKQTRTPRTPEKISKGLLSLPLQDRVNIMKILKSSIEEEVEQREQQAAEAKKIANGL